VVALLDSADQHAAREIRRYRETPLAV